MKITTRRGFTMYIFNTTALAACVLSLLFSDAHAQVVVSYQKPQAHNGTEISIKKQKPKIVIRNNNESPINSELNTYNNEDIVLIPPCVVVPRQSSAIIELEAEKPVKNDVMVVVKTNKINSNMNPSKARQIEYRTDNISIPHQDFN